MRLAVVVQRYGEEIRGGAELHALLVAEHLAKRHQVEVVTSCARDYVSWTNEYPLGLDCIHGIPVWRFPVARTRDPRRFGRLQERVFHRDHGEAEARAWMDEQGPYTPAMLRWIETHRDRFDYWICFSYRYWTTFHALQAVEGRGILVPTAEPDPTIEVPLFHPVIRSARGIVYNSQEERRMILENVGAHDVPGDVVGVGIVEPEESDPDRFRRRTRIVDPFVLYIGRIDENKGCLQLFDFFLRACRRLEDRGQDPPTLVLAGHAVLDVPDHPRVRYLGPVDEQLKYDALAASSALMMPSFFESLSMVLLEAWALEKPVLVNAHCDVLRGQVVRSSGGIYYADGDEFVEALALLLADDRLRRTCGENGRAYYENHYRWPVIEDKYERLLQRLAAEDRGEALEADITSAEVGPPGDHGAEDSSSATSVGAGP